VKQLKRCDGRLKGLLDDWDAWMTEADKLYSRFLDRLEASPFAYHEVASVGFLASAAVMAGFVSLAEYEIIKRGRHDKRTKGDGRADLWFHTGRRAYSFEFKRAYFSATNKNLTESLETAADDIACIYRDEYHYAAGGVLARVRDPHRLDMYNAFALSDGVDLSYRLGPDDAEGAFLYFKLA
jgi:hypothetical protein